MTQKQLTLLGGKIHRASVTQAELDYVGSITIDRDLMEAAGYREYEQVHIVNLNNGNRFETYVIAGEPGSGTICLNGGGARLACVGDLLIIMSYEVLDLSEVDNHSPRVVFVDDKNKIVKVGSYEKHGTIS